MASGNITGKVNVGLFKYEGVTTETAETVVNNEDRTISVNVNTEEVTKYCATKEDLKSKQDKLTAGSGINISEENVISADIPDVSWGNISGNIASQTDLQNEFGSVHSSIQDIENLIPEEASSQNKLADKELVSSALSSANSYTDSVVTTVKRNAYRDVNTTIYPTLEDFLESTGEEGFMYLYPIDTTDLSKGYKQYIWENSSWRFMGSTSLSLDGYAKLNEDNSWSGSNYFSSLSGAINYAENGQVVRKSLRFNLSGSHYINVTADNGSITLSGNAWGGNVFKFGVDLNNSHMNMSSGSLCPDGDARNDLGCLPTGGFSYRWRDIYLSRAIKNNNKSYGITIPDMSSWTADKTIATTDDIPDVSSFATLSGQNSFTQMNQFKEGLYVGPYIDDVKKNFSIERNGNSTILKANYSTLMSFSDSNNPVKVYNTFVPGVNNSHSLGNNDLKWKNLYLSGILTDGTNYATVSELVNKQDKIVATSADAGKVVTVDSEGNLSLTNPSAGTKLYRHVVADNNSGSIMLDFIATDDSKISYFSSSPSEQGELGVSYFIKRPFIIVGSCMTDYIFVGYIPYDSNVGHFKVISTSTGEVLEIFSNSSTDTVTEL